MSYALAAAVLVAVIAVTYVWWVTREYRHYPDDKILDLSGSDNDLLAVWYRTKLPETMNLEDETTIARRYLQRVHQLNIDSIVVGVDLPETYLRLTGCSLPLWNESIRTDSYIDLRREVGISGEIAIVQSAELRRRLEAASNEKVDSALLSRIMEAELEVALYEYLADLLEKRWDAISYPSAVRTGSYLYLPTLDMFEGRVTGLKTVDGYRLNLLCTELEFDTLLQRWKRDI